MMRPGAVIFAKLGWVFTAFWLAHRTAGQRAVFVPIAAAVFFTAVTYLALDWRFLVEPGRWATRPVNLAVSAGEGVLAALVLWAADRTVAMVTPMIMAGVPPVVFLTAGIGVAVGEWFIHLALRGKKPVAERENRPPGVSDE